jgi:hypothetical protein
LEKCFSAHSNDITLVLVRSLKARVAFFCFSGAASYRSAARERSSNAGKQDRSNGVRGEPIGEKPRARGKFKWSVIVARARALVRFRINVRTPRSIAARVSVRSCVRPLFREPHVPRRRVVACVSDRSCESRCAVRFVCAEEPVLVQGRPGAEKERVEEPVGRFDSSNFGGA